jgi:hypothetical protein
MSLEQAVNRHFSARADQAFFFRTKAGDRR